MAELPVLRDEQRRQTPRSPQLPRASEDAFGAQMGRGMRGLQRGLDDVANAAENIDQRLDAANARELDTLYANRERELLYAPLQNGPDGEPVPDSGGFLNLQGRNALERRGKVEEELRRYATELGEGARSGRARNAFMELNGRRMEATLDQITRHEAAQMSAYEDAVSEASMREAHDSAILLRHDPEQMNAQLDTIARHAEEIATRRGLGPEGIQRAIEERVSTARADIIITLSDEDPALATSIFDQWKGGMTAGDQMRVNEATQAVRLADRARRRWDEIWQETGGDYRRAYAIIETEQNTMLQAELYQHAERTRRVAEAAEEGDAENAAENARTAISRGGVASVRAADRALLIREGRWESIVNEFSGGGGHGRYSSGTSQFLLRLHADNQQAFDVIMRVMRDQRPPQGMREEDVDAMLRRETGHGVDDWLMAGQSMPAEDYVGFVQMHEYGQGNRAVGDEGPTLIQRTYQDVWAVAQMRAGQVGLALPESGSGAVRTQALSGYLIARSEEFVRQNNRAPNPDEMRVMVDDAFRRRYRPSRNPTHGSNIIVQEGRRVFEGNPSNPVRIPYLQIPVEDRRRLQRAWEAENPGSTDQRAGIRAVELAYAAEQARY